MLQLYKQRAQDLELAQDIAKLYVELNDPKKALAIFQICLKACGYIQNQNYHELALDDINIYCELLSLNSRYEQVAHVLTIVFAAIQSIPIDLRVKLAIALIHLDRTADSTEHLEVLFQMTLSEAPDLFYDVAIAYHDSGKYKDALNLLKMMND